MTKNNSDEASSTSPSGISHGKQSSTEAAIKEADSAQLKEGSSNTSSPLKSSNPFQTRSDTPFGRAHSSRSPTELNVESTTAASTYTPLVRKPSVGLDTNHSDGTNSRSFPSLTSSSSFQPTFSPSFTSSLRDGSHSANSFARAQTAPSQEPSLAQAFHRQSYPTIQQRPGQKSGTGAGPSLLGLSPAAPSKSQRRPLHRATTEPVVTMQATGGMECKSLSEMLQEQIKNKPPETEAPKRPTTPPGFSFSSIDPSSSSFAAKPHTPLPKSHVQPGDANGEQNRSDSAFPLSPSGTALQSRRSQVHPSPSSLFANTVEAPHQLPPLPPYPPTGRTQTEPSSFAVSSEFNFGPASEMKRVGLSLRQSPSAQQLHSATQTSSSQNFPIRHSASEGRIARSYSSRANPVDGVQLLDQRPTVIDLTQTAEEEALQRKGEEEMRQLIIALPDFVPRPKGYAIEATIVEDEGSAQKKDDEVVGDASSANQEDVPMQEGGIKRGERSKRKAVAMPGSDEEVQEIEVDYSVARKRIRISGQKAPQLSPHPLLRQALEAAEKMRPCDTHVMDSLFDRYAEGRETDDAKLRRLMILLMAKLPLWCTESITTRYCTAPNLKELNLRGQCSLPSSVFIAAFENLQTTSPNLETLVLANCGGKITNDVLQAVAKGAPSIKQLDISYAHNVTDAGMEDFFSIINPAQLCTLRVGGCFLLSNKMIECFCKNSQHAANIRPNCDQAVEADTYALREFDMSYCHYIDDTGVSELSRKCPRLASVIGNYSPNLTDNGYTFCAHHSANSLVCLSVVGNTISETCITTVVKACKNLRKLNLQDCTEVGDVAIHAICGHCPALKSLNVSHCWNITNVGAAHLPQLRLLEELRMFGVEEPSSVILDRIVAVCRKLKIIDFGQTRAHPSTLANMCKFSSQLAGLDISFCHALNAHAVYAVLFHCKRLRALRVWGMDFVNPSMIQLLRKLRPGVSLKYLPVPEA